MILLILMEFTFIATGISQMRYIEKKPTISNGPDSIKVLRDQPAIFVCKSTGNPFPQVSWLINDNLVSTNQHRYTVVHSSPQNSLLRIEPVIHNDNHSRITCQAASPMGKVFESATLTVYRSINEVPNGFPLIQSKSSVIVNEKNTAVTLPCSVNGKPKPIIVWLKDSYPVQMDKARLKQMTNGNLYISKSLEEDDGKYECVATNTHGTIVSSVIQLMIRVSYYAPHFVEVPSDQYVAAGSSISLKCRAVGIPLPKVYWLCGQTIRMPSYSPKNATNKPNEALIILSDLSESLKCSCVAKNAKESIKHNIKISIQESFASPSIIRVSDISATSCSVIWKERNSKSDQFKYQLVYIKTEDMEAGKNTSKFQMIAYQSIITQNSMITALFNLEPYTNYTIWIRAISQRGESTKSRYTNFVTHELPPATPPTDVQVVAISNAAVTVTWGKPKSSNGIITKYTIYYTKYPKKDLALWNKYPFTPKKDNQKQTKVLSHLQTNGIYYIRINAENNGGQGPATPPIKIKIKAGVIQAPNNLRAKVKSPTSIKLTWQPITQSSIENIVSFQLTYYLKNKQADTTIVKRWPYAREYSNTESNRQFTIRDLKPNSTYVFHLALVTTSVGMRATIEQVTPNKIVDYSVPVNAVAINSTSIMAKWTVDMEMVPAIVSFRIQCKKYVNNTSQFSPLESDKYLRMSSILPINKTGPVTMVINLLEPLTKYQVYLISITRQHSNSISISKPVQTWPLRLTEPQFLYLRLACQLRCVALSWQPPLTGRQWIKGYRVRFQMINGPKSISPVIIDRNVTKTQYTTSTLDHYLGFQYEFRVAAYSQYEMGKDRVDSIEIMEGKPSAPPYGFQIEKSILNSPTSTKFLWQALPQQALNGQLSHYEIQCQVQTNEQEGPNTITYNTTEETYTIRNLIEDTSYVCQVRVWTRKSYGPWSSPIHFKTKEAYLPSPQQIRLVRLSHSRAEITWLWQPEFLLYYSYFLIHITDEKYGDNNNKDNNNNNNNGNNKKWLTISTNAVVTKYYLSNLNATSSYIVSISSVSKRNIVGVRSEVVSEKTLSPESWPAKTVRKLLCAVESSSSIVLRWSTEFDIDTVIHFRVNFTGQTKYQTSIGKYKTIPRTQREQSLILVKGTTYFTHKIRKLKPNTKYRIDVEPIFSSESVFIGNRESSSCTTLKLLPTEVPTPQLIALNKKSSQLKIRIKIPPLQNGTIDFYYLIISTSPPTLLRHKRSSQPNQQVEDIFQIVPSIQSNTTDQSSSSSSIYTLFIGYHSKLFPSNTTESSMQRTSTVISIGPNDNTEQPSQPIPTTNQMTNLNISLLYSFKLFACLQDRKESEKTPFTQCRQSDWSRRYNLNYSFVDTDYLGGKVNPDNPNEGSLLHSKDGPNTFTTTTIVVILSLIILTVLVMLIVIYLRHRRNIRTKLGAIYNSNNTRLSKDKSMCLDQMLKEPLVNSQVITTSGSLRFNHHHSNPYLETTRLQLSSTPDLLVRSSVHQPIGPFVQYHDKTNLSKFPDKGPIPTNIIGEHIYHLKENDGKLFSLEYESIEPGQQFSWTTSNQEVNRLKNRYANVVAYDHSRVVLNSLPAYQDGPAITGSDYINANYIDGYMTKNAYIATQGPLAETIGDFWRMIWEQNSRMVVMMTRLEERDRAKCDQYWPLGGKGSVASYSYISVTLTEMVELAYYTIRRFTIQSSQSCEVREVRHLQFTAWPDHGVPSHPAPLLMFLRRVRAESPRGFGPMIVHCSAGVGRTGAFIVIDWMLERMRHEPSIDVYNCVTHMRSQRNYMVQTEEQYIFVHEVLLEAVQSGNTEVGVCQLAAHIDQLESVPLSLTNEIDGSIPNRVHPTGLQLEYEKVMSTALRITSSNSSNVASNSTNHFNHSPGHSSTPSTSYPSLLTNYAPLTYETANLPVNQMKNRLIQILPPDFSRVSLMPIRSIECSDYINASWVDGYRARKAYIASQAPLEETQSDFWRMIWQHKSTIIVMLTRLREGNRDRCYPYWPNQQSLIFDDIQVDPIAEYDMSTYIMREFRISRDSSVSQSNHDISNNDSSSSMLSSSMNDSNCPRVVRQFQFADWRSECEGLPQSTLSLLDMIMQVHKTRIGLGHDGPITVHCSAGTARTGIFIALSNVIERMRHESVIDLFQTVKLLRWQRPALLQTEDQYQYCYLAALEYLKMYEQLNFD